MRLLYKIELYKLHSEIVLCGSYYKICIIQISSWIFYFTLSYKFYYLFYYADFFIQILLYKLYYINKLDCNIVFCKLDCGIILLEFYYIIKLYCKIALYKNCVIALFGIYYKLRLYNCCIMVLYLLCNCLFFSYFHRKLY